MTYVVREKVGFRDALFRFLAASLYTLYNSTVTLRLLWVLDNVPGLRQAVEKGQVLGKIYECIEFQ